MAPTVAHATKDECWSVLLWRIEEKWGTGGEVSVAGDARNSTSVWRVPNKRWATPPFP